MIWPIPISEKTYIVTLYKHEDLEQFYNDMSDYHLVMKRPMSRNTHYKMTEEQAKVLRQDPRVWDVQLPPEELGMVMGRDTINYNEYSINGNFWKGDTQGASTVASTDRQWGQIHCAGDTVQRGKSQFGLINSGGTYEQVIETVNIFNDGKHVDVVICDDPVSYDCQEWFSPTTGQTRFIQYDWYGQLNTLVGTIDDDSQTLPTGSYPNYFDNATNTESHGTHVAGTVAGQHYGWAREANIYSLQVLSNTSNTGTPVPDLLIFDYLRAFHRNKAINPDTGIKNPTITNHSWSYRYDFSDILEKPNFDLSDFISVNYRGITYNSSNPNPSGWTFAGLEKDFGFASNKMKINSDYAAINADVEDAISEGVVVVAAAGNNNFHCVPDGNPDYSNTVTLTAGTYLYNRGASPGNSLNTICVGSLGNRHDFRRSTFSNFGPLINIFAPGNNILSAYDSGGLADTKYGGAPNYFYPIQGTSMASPQVAGVLACLATGKERFNQNDAQGYLDSTGIYNDMSWDAGSGSGTPAATFNITTTSPSFSYYTLNGTDRNGPVIGNNAGVVVYVGDTINFNLSNVSGVHPFRIRNSPGGTDVSTPAASGQGSSGNSTVSWTPNTVGDYVYQCSNHGSMYGTISVVPAPSNAGTFADDSCKKDSPDLYLIAKNPREGLTGMISKQVGARSNDKSALKYPRVSTFNRPAPAALSKTFTIAVTNIGAGSYVFNGSDRGADHVDAQDPVINLYQGDTLILTFNISGSHPFWIKTTQTTGTSNGVTTGTITNNGQQSSNLTWDTNGVTPGTYYYICQFHGGMSNSIIVT